MLYLSHRFRCVSRVLRSFEAGKQGMVFAVNVDICVAGQDRDSRNMDDSVLGTDSCSYHHRSCRTPLKMSSTPMINDGCGGLPADEKSCAVELQRRHVLASTQTTLLASMIVRQTMKCYNTNLRVRENRCNKINSWTI